SLAGTSQTLGQRANDLGDAAGKTGQFTEALARVLTANEGYLDGVFGDTRTVLDRIVADKDVLAKALQTLPWTTSAMIRATTNARAGDAPGTAHRRTLMSGSTARGARRRRSELSAAEGGTIGGGSR